MTDVPTPRLAQLEAAARTVAARDARRSPFVGTMKRVLPLLAVALIGLVLAWPQLTKRAEGFRISFSSIDPGDGAVTMLNARYRGVDKDNRPYYVTADTVTQEPGKSKLVALDRVAADLATQDGGWVGLSARTGLYDQNTGRLLLQGDVAVFTDTGYEVRGDNAEVDLNAGTVVSDSAVRMQGPLGELYGTGFRISDKGEKIQVLGRVRTVLYGGTS